MKTKHEKTELQIEIEVMTKLGKYIPRPGTPHPTLRDWIITENGDEIYWLLQETEKPTYRQLKLF